jgi:hypothetical protein
VAVSASLDTAVLGRGNTQKAAKNTKTDQELSLRRSIRQHPLLAPAEMTTGRESWPAGVPYLSLQPSWPSVQISFVFFGQTAAQKSPHENPRENDQG